MSNRLYSSRRGSPRTPGSSQGLENLFPLESQQGAPIDTHAHRDLIKEHGGRWDSHKRLWMVPYDKLALLHKLCAVSQATIRRRDAARTARCLEEERLSMLRSKQAEAFQAVRACLAKLDPSVAATPETEWERLDLGALDEAQKLALVKANGLALKYVREPSEEMQILGVQQDGLALSHLTQRLAVSEEVCLAAVMQNGLALEFVPDPSDAVIRAALQQNASAIRCLREPSEEYQMLAIERDCFALGDVPSPTERVQLAAVKKFGVTIKYIDHPSDAVQFAAVRQDTDAILFIEKPGEAAIEAMSCIPRRRW